MLFSIPESGWWLIAVAATVFFMAGVLALPIGLKVPDELRSTMDQQWRRGRRAFYVLTPVILSVVLAVNLLRPEPAPTILFLYSVTIASIPVALFPIRGRMVKDYIARQQNPGIMVKPDRLATAWIVGFLLAVCLAAALVLTATSYGR